MSILQANQAQLSAITHVSGPMLVLAGPGSGKTFVITERIRYLIEEACVAPSDILVITFSSAAASQMQERYRRRLDEPYTPVTFGTFHAVFFHILQHTYQYQSQSILKNEDKIQYLKEIIEEKQYTVTNEAEWLQEMTAYISRRKNAFSLNTTYEETDSMLSDIFYAYQDKCRTERRLDFDDMLLQCYRLFDTRVDILEAWRARYRYILIDEFQDINAIQYETVKKLAGDTCNLFAVGDDDQSIYGFRGAKPEIMRRFEQECPHVKRVILNQNYRSTAQIVAASERLIGHNKARYAKHMEAAETSDGSVMIRSFSDRNEELEAVAQEIKRLSERYAYESIAVLYRTGMTGGEIAERLMLASVPFYAKERISNLYQHAIARDMVAYANLILGDRSRKTFYQIMNKPKRYISRAAVAKERFDYGELLQYYSDKAYVTEAILKLKYDIRFMEHMGPYSALQYIAKGIGYEKYMMSYAAEKNQQPELFMHVFEELQERAREFQTIREWLEHIEECKKTLHSAESGKQQGVALSTIHASKGLEYDVVFIPDIYEGNIPHGRADSSGEIEEERRIFYVAMTRARQLLYLFYPKKHCGKELGYSRFVSEITGKRRHFLHRR